MIGKSTPDGEGTFYVYDGLGRLRFSQDTRQMMAHFHHHVPPPAVTYPVLSGQPYLPATYSYLKYDNLSRVIESWEALADWSLGISTAIPMSKVEDMSYPMIGIRYFTKTTYTASSGSLPGYLNDVNRGQRYLRNRVSHTFGLHQIGGDKVRSRDEPFRDQICSSRRCHKSLVSGSQTVLCVR